MTLASTSRWEQVPTGQKGQKGMPLFVAEPLGAATPQGAVVVIQEIFGVNEHIQSVANRVADLGYLAVAPDIFHAQGDRLEATYDQTPLGRSRKVRLSDEMFLADFAATVAWVRQRLGRQDLPVVVLGFCFGGKLAYLAAIADRALDLRLSGAVIFYGGNIAENPPPPPTDAEGTPIPPLGPPPITRTADIQCPLLLFFGAQDKLIPLEQVRKLEQALSREGKRFSLHVYDEAGHGFFCEARKDYRKDAATDAWTRVVAFLADAIKPPPPNTR